MELWDLYTRDRVKTDRTMVRGEAQPEGFYRMVVHVCIFNSKGEMLIQQRQPFKKGWPDMWDITVGGAAVSGDTSRTAIERELFEELGIKMSFTDKTPKFTVNFDKGFDDIYIVENDVELSELTLQPEEVKAVKWSSISNIFDMIDKGIFIPYDRSFIEFLFYMRNHSGINPE